MAIEQIVFFSLLLMMLLLSVSAKNNNQSEFFDLMKKSLSGDFMARWDGKHVCNYSGIGCDDLGHVVKIDISGCSLSGRFPESVCDYLPKLKVLRLGQNHFHGNRFPVGITNCSALEELNMTGGYLTGVLPDLNPLQALRSLDLSFNLFTGEFPLSVTNLSNLEVLNFNENGGFSPWRLPANISGLRKLKSLVLTACKLSGRIPVGIGSIESLVDLELSDNGMVGRIPGELGRLPNLQLLELYYNQLEGEIPEELGNLTSLVDLDLSGNRLIGKIPDSISCLPNLQVLQVYNNTLSGQFPAGLANSTTLRILSLYTNSLSGEIPENFGTSSSLVVLDLSENQFSGKLPPKLCTRGKLMYILLLQNMFSGELPASYGNCRSVVRFRVNYNLLEGKIPEPIFGLPHASIIDVSNNRLNGSIPKTIENAKNLSELFIQGNMISGTLPCVISRVTNLVKLDASNNLLSGPIPFEIGLLKRLNVLILHGNRLNSSIPESLSSLKSLNYLDLSNNLLMGRIPESLGELLPNPMNFSNNMLSGAIPVAFIKGGVLDGFSGNPGLCVMSYSSSSNLFPLCSQSYDRKKTKIRWYSKQRDIIIAQQEHQELTSYDVKSFHKVNFEQREIFEGLVEKNKVGEGGSGTVYKVNLSNGEAIAVKKLRSRKGKQEGLTLDRELKTELRGGADGANNREEAVYTIHTVGAIHYTSIIGGTCRFSFLKNKLHAYKRKGNDNMGQVMHALYQFNFGVHWKTTNNIRIGVEKATLFILHELELCILWRQFITCNILLRLFLVPNLAIVGRTKFCWARVGLVLMAEPTTLLVSKLGYVIDVYTISTRAMHEMDFHSLRTLLQDCVKFKKKNDRECNDSGIFINNVFGKKSSCKRISTLKRTLQGNGFCISSIWKMAFAFPRSGDCLQKRKCTPSIVDATSLISSIIYICLIEININLQPLIYCSPGFPPSDTDTNLLAGL
nr:receptor-like protein kinase HSL1 [Ipomoea batatas]